MWLLNMILGKSGFGTIILALVVLQVITSIVASGFVSVLLYRVSRLTVTDIETARSMTGLFCCTVFLLAQLPEGELQYSRNQSRHFLESQS